MLADFMVDAKARLNEGWLHCRAVIELIGKPKEHIERTIKEYIEKLKKEVDIEVVEAKVAEVKHMETGAKQEEMIKDLWATFAEVEMVVRGPMTLTYFCLNYMPASLEILGPENVKYTGDELTEFFNDLQARLHQVDMIAKQMKTEVMFLRKTMHGLLKNYITVLLSKGALTAEQLSELTGVSKDFLEDFLDVLIDEGKISMEGENYVLVGKSKGEVRNEE